MPVGCTCRMSRKQLEDSLDSCSLPHMLCPHLAAHGASHPHRPALSKGRWQDNRANIN